MGSVSQSAPPLPEPQLVDVAPGITLLHPLSRKGSGPGLIVFVDELMPTGTAGTTKIRDGFPSPALKWAEESYTVVEVRANTIDQSQEGAKQVLQTALDALRKCHACEPKDVVGLVAFNPKHFAQLVKPNLSSYEQIKGYVLYDSALTPSISESTVKSPSINVPSIHHLAGKASTKLPRAATLTAYDYPTATSHSFANPFAGADFHSANEAVAHTRNLTFLKKVMDGPYFDLEAIWDEHTYWEFENRSTEMTMSTMVQEPYVNHIPTMTGGIGRNRLSDFYQNHFIFNNPDDTELELISRTVGVDRVVDEFIYKFTHTMVIDWLLPGVPPTNLPAQIPFTAVVNVRGDRLYHEHIAWDQSTVLRQLGLLPTHLPFPHDLPPSHSLYRDQQGGQKVEYRVPSAGRETADKMRDKNGITSNQMFEFGVRMAGSEDEEVKKE